MGAQFDLSHINLVAYLTDETGLAAPRSDLDTIGKFLILCRETVSIGADAKDFFSVTACLPVCISVSVSGTFMLLVSLISSGGISVRWMIPSLSTHLYTSAACKGSDKPTIVIMIMILLKLKKY